MTGSRRKEGWLGAPPTSTIGTVPLPCPWLESYLEMVTTMLYKMRQIQEVSGYPCIGGSVVEFSPATREARVRFPANALAFFFFFFFLSPKDVCISCLRFLPNIILEKEIATHSSILAWKISWTDEPGGLESGIAESYTT